MKKINWVVGSPIAHSMSPILHNALYQQLGVDAVMQAKEYVDAAKLIADIRRESIGLTAVTMPLKNQVEEHLDELSGAAKKLGLVNTIINQNNRLIGYNTDLDGIEYSFKNTYLDNKKILILGAGSVAKIVGYYFQSKTQSIYWLNRTKEKSNSLAKLYGGIVIEAENIRPDVIVNTTALGMLSCPGMPVNSDWIVKNQTVFDVVYNPLETELLKEAYKKGAACIADLDMFVVQALRQIEIWQDKKIISDEVIKVAKEIVKRGIEK